MIRKIIAVYCAIINTSMHRVDRVFSVEKLTASIPSHYTLKGDISRTVSFSHFQ
jgi:hypothetical protein